jgi:hypothetical protein
MGMFLPMSFLILLPGEQKKYHSYTVSYPLDEQGESLALLFGYSTAIDTNDMFFEYRSAIANRQEDRLIF